MAGKLGAEVFLQLKFNFLVFGSVRSDTRDEESFHRVRAPEKEESGLIYNFSFN